MSLINENYLELQDSYLFSTIAKKVAKFTKENPDKKILKLGIGDVTKPIVPKCIEAMHKAIDEIGTKEGFKGYGPEQGYEFLRNAIVQNDYKSRNIDIEPDEIFVSDGAKCDSRKYCRYICKRKYSSYNGSSISSILRYKCNVRKKWKI